MRVLTELRLLRIRRRKRLIDISIATGIGEGRLSRIERGDVKPSARDRERLESYFNKSIRELLRETPSTDAA